MKNIQKIQSDIANESNLLSEVTNDKSLSSAQKKRQSKKHADRIDFLKKCIVLMTEIPNMSDGYLQNYIEMCNTKIRKLQSETAPNLTSEDNKAFRLRIEKEIKIQRDYISNMAYLLD